jgi:hypothetical protein
MSGERVTMLEMTADRPYFEGRLTAMGVFVEAEVLDGSTSVGYATVDQRIPQYVALFTAIKDCKIDDVLAMWEDEETEATSTRISIVKTAAGVSPGITLTEITDGRVFIEPTFLAPFTWHSCFQPITWLTGVTYSQLVKDGMGKPLHNVIKAGETVWARVYDETNSLSPYNVRKLHFQWRGTEIIP